MTFAKSAMINAGLAPLTREDMVLDILKRGGWVTLKQLAEQSGYPEASVSCSIRTLRKPQYGHKIVKELSAEESSAKNRIYRYRLEV